MTTLADFRMPPWLRRTFSPLVRIVCTDEAVTRGLVEPTLEQVELSIRSFPPFLRLGLVIGAFVFQYGAIVLPSSRLRPFSRLPPSLQDAWFKRFWNSRVGAFHQLAKGLKASVALGYWSLPEVQERLQYHPERWIAEVAARRLRDYGDDIRAHDALVIAPDPLVRASRLTREVRRAKAS